MTRWDWLALGLWLLTTPLLNHLCGIHQDTASMVYDILLLFCAYMVVSWREEGTGK